MKKKYDKNSEEFRMFQDYWAYIQEYAEPEENGKFWDDLMAAGNELCQKYDNCKYIKRLVLAHIERLEKPSN